VGLVQQRDSPFGCAAEFDGKSRISVSTGSQLDFNRSFSASAWINGSGSTFRTLSKANRRGPSFQVVGDAIYFVTNSDLPADNRTPRDGTYKSSAKGAPLHYRSAIWSGVTDVNLGNWNDRRRTYVPWSGLEPKLQVVGERLFFEYFGGDADGAWHIYTGTSGADGEGWQVQQRTFGGKGYIAEQSRNIQVAGDRIYYAYPLKDENGAWQLWTATSNIDGSSWKAVQQTTTGGLIPSFRVSGDKVYYAFLSSSGENSELVVASAHLDGSGWRVLRRVPRAGPWIIAQLTVDKGIVYYTFSKRDSKGNAHLWTGSIREDGSSAREIQRTFGEGNATPAGIQVVGDKVLYSFSSSTQPTASMKKPGRLGMSFWTASSDLQGDHWVQHKQVESDKDDYLIGYKMLAAVGGKSYYDLMRLHYVDDKDDIVRYVDGILAYSGSNILSKGDAYGIGMSASGSVSGFVNAGEDYLYRGEAPKDIAGAMVEQKLVPGWHHVVVTYDGSILRLYVDGALTRETRYGKKPATNHFPLSIGDGFVGKMAQVMLFDRVLDQSDISLLADKRNKAPCRRASR
jgi:hypothetical protein